ncbi:MAG: hypothetical protein DMG13_28595 [Acidobacteria bacterium]|nr:MAG: hypothetical protein DMG13_28595 [Acidobacteriota bacterium]
MKQALKVVLLIAVSVPAHAAGKRTELDGVWILLRADIGKVQLTPEGEKKRAAYDFQKDDPDFQCKPASITRVMHTPSPPIEVRQYPDHVEINYEFMDVHRRVPLKKGLAPKDAPYAVRNYPHLGRSVGQYDGETLVVETAGQRAGVLDTLGVPGLYQSDQMRTVEHFIPDGDRMQIVVTHQDPVYFVQPLTVTFNYLRLPGGKIEKWDCKPEEATFERFIPSKK